jgi:hypothetical protein
MAKVIAKHPVELVANALKFCDCEPEGLVGLSRKASRDCYGLNR